MLPTTKHDYSFNLFNNTVSVHGDTNSLGEREYLTDLTIKDAKRIFPEDAAYIDWFWKTYGENECEQCGNLQTDCCCCGGYFQ